MLISDNCAQSLATLARFLILHWMNVVKWGLGSRRFSKVRRRPPGRQLTSKEDLDHEWVGLGRYMVNIWLPQPLLCLCILYNYVVESGMSINAVTNISSRHVSDLTNLCFSRHESCLYTSLRSDSHTMINDTHRNDDAGQRRALLWSPAGHCVYVHIQGYPISRITAREGLVLASQTV